MKRFIIISVVFALFFSVSASVVRAAAISGCTPSGNVLVTSTSTAVAAAPAPGQLWSIILVQNSGANNMYCKMGGPAIATTSDFYVPANGGLLTFPNVINSFGKYVPPPQGEVDCITIAGSTIAAVCEY